MFRRKKDDEEDSGLPDRADDLGIPLKPGQRTAGTMMPTPTPTRQPTAAMPAQPVRPTDLPRRPSDAPGATLMPPMAPPPPKPRETEARRLIVGRDISLSGEITSCDQLVVEGSVEANLANCRDVEIAETGLFKGSASIEQAEVRGRFDGTLTVRGRLFIRATGKVVGVVRYGQLEIECGGQMSGDVQSQPVTETQDRSPRAPMAASGEARA
jgi:cytoskeletal protein CcmA (bactofilin family)